MPTRLTLATPRFHFPQLIHSHGWAWLAPFHWDAKTQTLSRPITLSKNHHPQISLRARQLTPHKTIITLTTPDTLTPAEKQTLRQATSRMLCLNEDFSEFHALCAADPTLAHVARSRAGGMLRSPTLFEDLIKTVCTINCAWANSKKMCQALCQLGAGPFPSPSALLKLTEKQLAQKAPLGYRAKTILQIARLTQENKLPLDTLAAQKNFEKIRELLTPIWGLGPYALSHILVLLGSYDTIPIDSETTNFLRKNHFKNRPIHPKKLTHSYTKYGKYQFLAFQSHRLAARQKKI